MLYRQSLAKYQSGQAYAETLVGFGVIGLFLFGAHHLWRYSELRQATVDAVRFAAWERVVWEPSDNDAEKFALHKTDESIAKDAVLHQLSTPLARRKFRESISQQGESTAISAKDRRNTLNVALKSFVPNNSDPDDLVNVTTSSGWPLSKEGKFRGEDPTLNTLTSLELDKDTYRTVSLSMKSQFSPSIGASFFNFLFSDVDTTKKLSLITNSWAGSPPIMVVRAERQLMPLSAGYDVTGTKPNNLAFYGMDAPSGGAGPSLSSFFGMVPFWKFVAGPNGFAGQYIVHQVGLDAHAISNTVQSFGPDYAKDYSFNMANPAGSLMLDAQVQQGEYFNPNAVSSWHHRHTFVTTDTAEHKAEPGVKARNSNLGKLKYRSFSAQSPVDTYYAAP